MTFLSQPSSAHLLAVLVVGVVSALSNTNSHSNSNSNIITSRRRLYNWSRNNNNNYNNNGGSTTESIRPAACVALAVEPNDDAEAQDFAANSLTVVEERSYMYYYYKGSYYDTSEPYIIDFSNFLGAFSAVYGMEDITSCQSLSSYSSDVFGSSTYANVVGSYDLYWGPLCNKGGKSMAMGVFGDDQCTQYLPELSNTLDAYLYNNNKNDDVPSAIQTYHDQVLAVNKAFQYDIGCAEGSWGGNICPTIFSSSMDTSSCQVMYDNSNNNDNDNNNGGRKLEEDAADAAEEDNNNADDADAADDETESETASAAEYQLTQDDLADGQSACYAAVNAANSGSSLYDHLSALGLDVASASNKNKNGGGASKAVKVISILIVLLLLGAGALYLMKRIKRKGGPSRRSRDKSKKEPLVKVDENDNIQDPYVVVTDDGAASASAAAGRDDQLMEDEEVDAEQTPRSNKKKRRFLGFLRKQ